MFYSYWLVSLKICIFQKLLLCYYNILYIGNKCDLEENRQVELSEADAMCEYFPELLSVLETSAKENKNIEEAFVTIASELKVNFKFLKLSILLT